MSQSVLHEVEQRLVQQRRVRSHHGQIPLHVQTYRSSFVELSCTGYNGCQDIGRVERLKMCLDAARIQTCHVEQLLHVALHARCFILNRRKQAVARRGIVTISIGAQA
jgi:hypothetical protein